MVRFGMVETRTIEIEVTKATAERLDELARATERTAQEIAREAIDHLLEVEAWQQKAIGEAIAEADAGGPSIAHEDMDRWLASWGAENELEPPEPTVHR